MEEKKFDLNSLLGFILIGGILIWMLYLNQPTEEELQERARTEAAATEEESTEPSDPVFTDFSEAASAFSEGDSLVMAQLQNRLGSFAYSAALPSAKDAVTVLENDVLYLEISNKGGYISKARLKKFTKFDSVPVHLIKDKNAE